MIPNPASRTRSLFERDRGARPMCDNLERSSMRAMKLLVVGMAMLLLSACATGSRQRYSCGVPDGPPCQSVLATYAKTHGDGNGIPAPIENLAKARSHRAGTETLRLAQNAEGDLVFEAEQPLLARPPAEPVPEREPAIVMRIWIAPWQDARGDLHAATYRYTEIAPARWRHARLPVEPRQTFFRVAPAAGGRMSGEKPEIHPAAEEAP